MRTASRLLISAATLVVLAWPAAARAGGGGHGGVCLGSAPNLSDGWVAVMDSCFAPQDIDVAAGNTVHWELMGSAPHTVTFDEGIDSGQLNGSDFAMRINIPGTYIYSCSFHPGMTGSVTVSGVPQAGAAMEVLGLDGQVVDSATTAGATVAAATAPQNMRVELDPLTAFVLLAILFPLSGSAALALARFPGRAHAAGARRIRLRKPWETVRPQAQPQRRGQTAPRR